MCHQLNCYVHGETDAFLDKILCLHFATFLLSDEVPCSMDAFKSLFYGDAHSEHRMYDACWQSERILIQDSNPHQFSGNSYVTY